MIKMKFKDIKNGRIAIPEDDDERTVLEELVTKGIVEYYEGGYWLNKKGIKICKKMGCSNEKN